MVMQVNIGFEKVKQQAHKLDGIVQIGTVDRRKQKCEEVKRGNLWR